MENIHTINKFNTNPQLLSDIYKLRHKSFKQRLGWEVKSVNGMEIDNFDSLDVSHIALSDDKGQLVGCWRALPTKGDYMLRNIFPQLLRGEGVPSESNIWEISRFTVNKDTESNSEENKSLVSMATCKLVASFYTFAKANDIDAYVLVTTVACERILRNIGVTMRRLGDGKSMKVGIENSVALRIEVNDNLKLALN
jgi:acyl homoserine lactone synthase